ncbi:hypothetical protein SEPCBS119000_001817 [Sporothrix epigloea]|uniref:DUF2293 domain-containing protein n=1 Tax=Sporothrix epigloea TaxID=1892477 RepID=A0ABP0DCS5_9PEZI
MANDEEIVLPTTPMPRGYTFVRKGNVYITANCRRATLAEGSVVYTVVQDLSRHGTVLGIRCPHQIAAEVRAAERASRAARHAATDKRDAALAATFRSALLARYPAVPVDIVPRIVEHAMRKHAGGVARTGTLDLEERVQLAVRAHIRHCWTDYETQLRELGSQGDSRGKAKKGKPRRKQNRGRENDKVRAAVRALTVGQVNAIERQWATSTDHGRDGAGTRKEEQAAIDALETTHASAGSSMELAIDVG